MPMAELKRIFPLSADRLWDVIGDFGDTGKWTGRPPEACVPSGEGIGALRTLSLEDGRQIVDRLEAVGDKTYSYSIVTSPLPVVSYRATMTVTAIDASSCEFTWSGEFEQIGMSDAEAVAFWEGIYRQGIGLMERNLGIAGGKPPRH